MTQLSPNLQVRRLVLFAKGQCVYDEKFKNGVNIIRSVDNSCGKSTVMDFIYYVLGGDVTEWRAAAQEVDFGWLEIVINASTFTLKREVQPNARPSTYVFDGPIDAAKTDAVSWAKYGAKRTDNQKSLSQVIFELLGFPEQKTKQDENVTFTQILRLIYCDQETPVNRIYKDVSGIDQESMRQTVIEILLGVDDFELHSMRAKSAELQITMSALRGSIKSLKDTLRQVYEINEFGSEHFDQKIATLEGEIQATQAEIESLAANERTIRQNARQKELKGLEDKVVATRAMIAKERDRLAQTLFEIEDSARFIESLIERSTALAASIAIKDFFGSLDFQFCPICLAELKIEPNDHTCGLCKSQIDAGTRSFNRLKAKAELDFQLKESKDLLALREANREQIDQEIESLTTELKRQERLLSALIKLPSYADQEIFGKMNEIGYKERQIEDIVKHKHLGQLLLKKIDEEGTISGQMLALNEKIKLLESGRDVRWNESQTFLEKSIIKILSSDIGVEEAFKDPQEIEIRFEKNKVTVDGVSKFSASSGVILKNSLFLSLLALSLHDKNVRYPRFLMLDNIEDKGMTPNRSHNFQKIIVDLSKSAQVDHQIIFTTSMIDPSLDNDTFCVGPKYTPDNKTLKLPTKIDNGTPVETAASDKDSKPKN